MLALVYFISIFEITNKTFISTNLALPTWVYYIIMKILSPLTNGV